MTTIARRVAAVPIRSSVDTWDAICELLAPPGSGARHELASVTSVAAVLIAEEYTATAPIIVTGTSGPRVRIYTVHGNDAADAEADETPLPTWACDEDDWGMSLPCAALDLGEMMAAVGQQARFTVRDMDENLRAGEDRTATPSAPHGRPVIDLAELSRP